MRAVGQPTSWAPIKRLARRRALVLDQQGRWHGKVDLLAFDADGGMARRRTLSQASCQRRHDSPPTTSDEIASGPALHQAALLKAVVATIADDDVIEYVHAE
jgi:hypothetical protein